MPKVERPRGTRDFKPEEMGKRRALEERFRASFASYGYREVATPTFEHTDLFEMKSGEGVKQQIYHFKDKGDRDLALRPELTAPVLRFYVNELSREPKPLKLFYFGPCFRYEEPQKGRYREFWQFGLELIGPSGPEADAEAIGVAHAALSATGLKNFHLHVGHIGVLRALVAATGLAGKDAGEIFRRIDKDDRGLEDFLAERKVDARLAGAIAAVATHKRRLVLGDEEGAPRAVEEYFAEALTAVKPGVSTEVFRGVEANIARLKEMLGYLATYGVGSLEMDLGVARGLDYYTGVVFEFEAPELGAEKQIGGGGAYALAELFGGEPVGSVGFGLGFDRILLALEKEGRAPAVPPAVELYIAALTDAARVAALELASALRKEGLRVDVDLMRRKLAKNLDYASGLGAPFVAILGEKELAQGIATLRNMKSGEQREVKLAELARAIRGK
ncbi:MAG: histidine--tRNA ligase [Thermoplasmatota archaeon]